MMLTPARAQAGEVAAPTTTHCRFCGAPLAHVVVDLGMSPLCERYLSAEQLNQMEPFYPLRVYLCDNCFLVQLEEYVPPDEIFTEYAYFSSYSESWLRHAAAYTEMIVARLGLDRRSQVVEVGSNDGYLLQYFLPQGNPVLGVEPARNVAQVAIARGIPTVVRFFGRETARELRAAGKGADLLIGNNVLAQVPDLNDFVVGLAILLNSAGTITMEFPHLLRLIEQTQFDTIYHEHFSYFSITAVERILAAHGLRVTDVEEIPTHGGSLRIFARHADESTGPPTPRVQELKAREAAAGLLTLEVYTSFARRVEEVKWTLVEFLIGVRRQGKTVAGYGAPGKGNTLLNYCGIRTDLLDYTVDRNPYKQGKFLPGTHVPIYHPDRIAQTKPDYVLILPWNLKDEITAQLAHVRDWGGRFVVPIPRLEVHG